MAIYIPSGGISTKDATALPGDVREGKIFYNQDGRQSGIWTPSVKDLEKSFSITIELGYMSSTSKGNMLMMYNTDYKIDEFESCKSVWHDEQTYFTEAGINVQVFTGITFDGDFHPITLPIPKSIESGSVYAQFNDGNGWGRFTIGVNDSAIWAFYGGIDLDADNAESYKGKMIMVHYI